MRRFTFSSLNNKHFLALAGNALMSVISLVQGGILYRAMSLADVGTWFFFLSIISLGDALRNGLLSTATVKFYAGAEKERADTVLGSVWFLATMLTLLFLLIDGALMLLQPMIRNDLAALSIQWFGLTLLSTLPTSIMFWKLVADERYDRILLLRLVNYGSMLIVIIVLAVMKNLSITTLLWCNLLTNVLACVVGFLWGLSSIWTFYRMTRECIAELFHFGKYSLGTSVITTLYQKADVYIITFMLGADAVAIYSVPLRLMEIAEMPLRSFVGTGMSAMAAAYNNKNYFHVSHVLKKYSGLLTFAFMPLAVFFFFFSDVAIHIYGGAKYMGTEAANILRIFMIISLMYPIDRFNGVGLDIVHKPRINFYKVIIMLMVNVAGDFTGLYFFQSIYAVALSTFVTIGAGLLFGYFQLRKYMEFSIRAILAEGFNETKLQLRKVFKR